MKCLSNHLSKRFANTWLLCQCVSLVCVILVLGGSAAYSTETSLEKVVRAQADRMAMIDRVSPAVVAVYDTMQRGGGSGVLIDSQGYGITNYHVVAGMLDTRRGWGGLSNGTLYRLEVLGIDPTGDVAMFRLIGPDEFPYAKLGDSDKVRLGDTAFAMGNPFILAEHYSPTVTRGLVTGIHRYQEGVKGNLTYSDCIQVDTSINPGNSGGPLFNIAGQVIGINGRISLNTRGRFNVGHGYAIASNQIKRFIPALRAGLLAKHGTLQARVESGNDGTVVFSELLRDGPAFDAGIRVGDRLLTIDGVHVLSPNHFASLLGTYPEHWHMHMVIEHAGKSRAVVVTLDPKTPKMRKAFQADASVNATQVRRVIQSFQKRHAKGVDLFVPADRQWTVTRFYKPNGDTKVIDPQQFFVFDHGGDSIVRQQVLKEGGIGRTIEYRQDLATQQADMNAEPAELTADEQMILGAYFILQRRLFTHPDYLDLNGVKHVGSDVLFDSVIPDNPKASASATSYRPGKMVELIRFTVAREAEATIAFDAESWLPVAIELRDIPSGMRASLRLSQFNDVNGMTLPEIIEVQGPGYDYREVFSDWEIEP